MQTEHIVALLVTERDRLSRAIEVLQGVAKHRGRPRKAKDQMAIDGSVVSGKQPARKRTLSAAGRKAIAEAARRRWAAIKAGKKPSPFTAAKRKK